MPDKIHRPDIWDRGSNGPDACQCCVVTRLIQKSRRLLRRLLSMCKCDIEAGNCTVQLTANILFDRALHQKIRQDKTQPQCQEKKRVTRR